MRRAVCTLLLCLLSAGMLACGSEDGDTAGATEQPTAIPKAKRDVPLGSPTPSAPQRIPAAVKAQLADGQVGLFDAFGATSIRPDTVQFAADTEVAGVRWSRWAPEGAEGTGTMRVRSCNPNCAEGPIEKIPATVTLSQPRSCDGRLYFSAGVVAAERGPKPQSYLRAPC